MSYLLEYHIWMFHIVRRNADLSKHAVYSYMHTCLYVYVYGHVVMLFLLECRIWMFHFVRRNADLSKHAVYSYMHTRLCVYVYGHVDIIIPTRISRLDVF